MEELRLDEKELTDLVRLEYDFSGINPPPFDDEGCLSGLSNGMTPVQAKIIAGSILARSLPQNVSGI